MTKEVKIGNVAIGNGNKIAIQSMTNVKVSDVDATVDQINRLTQCGCDIVRFAVTDEECCKAIAKVKQRSSVPLVADIHFDYRLALSAMENGVDKIRINPGNLRKEDMFKVIDCAKMHGTAIRIGVNGGSVDKRYMSGGLDKTNALVNNLVDFVTEFEDRGFDNLVLSAKSSSVAETVAVNRIIAQRCNYPLHIGVTEAGLLEQGLLKNAIGIGSLLLDGIGDTIRVSLTDDPIKEVESAKKILRALGKGGGVTFVSCPKCGRCCFDLYSVANAVYERVKDLDCPLKIAVMGCEVNGPGECADADLGLAGGHGKVAFFKKGKVFRTVDESVAVEEFIKELQILRLEKSDN